MNEPQVWVAIQMVPLLGLLALLLVGWHLRQQRALKIREMQHRERLAAIEKGQTVPEPLAPPRLSPGFEARLRARLAAERSPECQRLRRVMRWYWGLGVVAAVETLAYALLGPGPGSSGVHAFTGLALLLAALELLPGRPAVSLVELVRRTLR